MEHFSHCCPKTAALPLGKWVVTPSLLIVTVLIAKVWLKKVITKTMSKPTTKEYVTKARRDYYSGITKTMINRKVAYESKGKFLDDLRNNAFSGTNVEIAVEHIENFLKIIDPLDLPNISYERLRIDVFPISLTRDAMFENWLALKFTNQMMMDPFTKNALWDYWKKGDDQEVLTDEAFSDLKESYKDGEHEITKIYTIKTDIFDVTPPNLGSSGI
ncbi:hypothetical protein Tco_0843210 [Tanacetum coccineum]|uniref:Uncharacterized protein n=1 Tax=Tanacetum coccineum TaxID=301880 RepID=A0ABQ5B5F0_9ASTR